MYGAKQQRSAFKVTAQAESVKYSMVSTLQTSFLLSFFLSFLVQPLFSYPG
jgi:hypothetical protein